MLSQVNFRLTELIRFAKVEVPYYRRAWDHLPVVESIEALPELPFISKFDVQQQPTEFCSDDIAYRKTFRHSTSGSTGIPLSIIVEEELYQRCWDFVRWGLNHVGFSPARNDIGDWIFVVISDNTSGVGYSRRVEVKGGPIYRRIVVNANTIENHIEDICSALSPLNKCILHGMPTVLRNLAQLKKVGHIWPRVPLVMVSGDQLTEETRKIIQEAFQARCINAYGLSETGTIAFECLSGSMHFDPTHVIIEAVSTPTLEKATEIVITTLSNRVMPLIRYRTGDLGSVSWESCQCGSNFPRVVKLRGRVVEYFIDDNGHGYNPYPMDSVLRKFPVDRYQILQRRTGTIEYRYEGDLLSINATKSITRAIQAVCGKNTQVDFFHLTEWPLHGRKSMTYISEKWTPQAYRTP